MAPRSAQRYSRLILTVPRPFAEAYGAALIELGAGAVEELPKDDPATVELAMVLADDEPLEPWQELCRTLAQAFAEQTGLSLDQFSLRSESHEHDYHADWLSHLTLIQLTPSLVLAPDTDRTPTPDGFERLRFTPEPAFGDGTHVTTQLAATALETMTTAHPGLRVLDVGTGNGVLSLVAAKHHAFAVGLDIDEEALASARHNAELNALDERCLFSSQSVSELEERFPCVVGNLEPLVQLELAQAIAERVLPSGTLVLTGFLEEQVKDIVEVYEELGFSVRKTETKEQYALVVLEAPGDPVA